jgi:hypothetical protein
MAARHLDGDSSLQRLVHRPAVLCLYWFEHVLAVGAFLGAIPLAIAAAWTVRRALRARAMKKLDYLDCPFCGYRLQGLPQVNYCPECGEVYSPEVLRIAWAIKLGVNTPDTPSTSSPPAPHRATDGLASPKNLH